MEDKRNLKLPGFILALLFFQSCSADVRIERDEMETGFIPFQKAEECFNSEEEKVNEPRCKFTIKSISSVDAGCFKSVDGTPFLRVQGNFNRFKIQCTASYAIDFIYYGIIPNEAMIVNWWKNLDVSSPDVESPAGDFVVEVDVYSVQALYEYYNKPENSPFVDHNDGLPYPMQHDYPRTGNFTFPGIFDARKDRGFYFILEDSAKPEFLRNNRTIVNVEGQILHVPCISSHLDGKIEITTSNTSQLQNPNFNVIRGFSYATVPSTSEELTCVLKYKGNVVDTLKLKYEPGKLHYLPGFLELPDTGQGFRIEAEGTDFKKYTSLSPWCSVTKPDHVTTVDVLLIFYPMRNFGDTRLKQLFAWPDNYNKSYAARWTNEYDTLVRRMTIKSPTTCRMLATYCRYGTQEEILDMGASVTVNLAVGFKFGRDWAMFNRRNSAIKTHFILNEVPKDKTLFIDTNAKFACKANMPVVARPLVWYSQRKNGSFVRELIDYKLEDDVSFLEIRLTDDFKEIYCFGSYWYSTWYRNISMPLKLQVGVPPVIVATNTRFVFVKGDKGGSIKCEASGSPPPTVHFLRKGNSVGQSLGNQSIVDFHEGTSAITGIYTCVASSELGSTAKEFTVELDSGFDIWAVVGIAVAVMLITILGAIVYIKFFRPEKTGLTKEEIEEFIKGLKEGELGANKGEYAHDFAHLVPYTGEHEIQPHNFKIDLTDVLGSGAYGMVLKGEVKQEVVAVKTTKRGADKQYLKALLSELKIMIYLGRHPNLIQMVGAYTKELSKGLVYVFVKYMPLGSLEKFLRSNKSYFTGISAEYTNTVGNQLDSNNSFGPENLFQWTCELACGLDYLSSKKVIHGDLAARNILLDANKTVRITDFGLSRQLYDYSDYVKKQQEPLPWRWMALESLKFLSFSTASDVWSFGITVWEIYSLGEVPYPGYSWTLQFVDELENGLRMACPKYAPHHLYALLTQCWHQAPERRPLFGPILDQLGQIRTIQKNEPEKLGEPPSAAVAIIQPKPTNEYTNTSF